MRVFLAGIMQGSLVENTLHRQDYRADITKLLNAIPKVEVYDPLAGHSESLEYDDETARTTFLNHNRMCGDFELLVAFVPEASMGTAIEMWEAARNHTVVTTISPLVHNWAVRFCTHLLYPTVEEFSADVRSGIWLEKVTQVQESGIGNAAPD
jgi:hypothetical protein